MPVRFLSDADHACLNRFPAEVATDDLDRFFWLSDDERQLIQQLRRPHNQLGFGLQLSCLRYLGFFPEDLHQLPQAVIEYVADQLQVDPDVLAFYGQRGSTQRDHQRQIQTRLGYRRALSEDIQALEQWLLTRAWEHDAALLLFQMACDWLRQKQLIRVGTTRLEKLVATVRSQAQAMIYDSLQPLLTEAVCEFLDGLLKVDKTLKRTRLSWLQRTPTDNRPLAN
jgi:TnpA family transposase